MGAASMGKQELSVQQKREVEKKQERTIRHAYSSR